jgi:hypothetical protein
MIRKNFYQNSDDTLKFRCTVMKRYVENAILRLSVLQDLSEIETKSNTFSEVIYFNRKNPNASPNTSSEVDAKSKSNGSKKSSEKDKTNSSKTTSSDAISTDKFFRNEISAASESDLSEEEYVSSQNIISKMLMSPESLVNVCLAKGDFQQAQNILRVSKLKFIFLDCLIEKGYFDSLKMKF